MRKWRPTHKCFYIIPEIKGNIKSLELIFNRILPLRKFKTQEDQLICLGNYINDDEYSYDVIETLINTKEQFNERIILLRGEFEELLLLSLKNDNYYRDWMLSGGIKTIKSYLSKLNLKSNPESFPQSRLKDIIPKHHIDFMSALPYTHEYENYLFFCTGFNMLAGIEKTNNSSFCFDKSSAKLYAKLFKENKQPAVEKVLVGGYSYDGEPVIFPNYFQLGGTAPKKIICGDLNSMEFVAAKRNKNRIYPTEIKIIE